MIFFSQVMGGGKRNYVHIYSLDTSPIDLCGHKDTHLLLRKMVYNAKKSSEERMNKMEKQIDTLISCVIRMSFLLQTRCQDVNLNDIIRQ